MLFRSVKILHEIGNETESVYDKNNNPLPQVDPITEAYRPGGRGFNYRSEPFMNRLAINHHEKAHSYSSSMFGDPATIIPKGYVGDPTKFRVVHAGAEVFHVYHLHGGGDRWRMNPEGDPTNNYANTGLAKTPVEQSASDRLDAYATGPGESFNAEIEDGAGGGAVGVPTRRGGGGVGVRLRESVRFLPHLPACRPVEPGGGAGGQPVLLGVGADSGAVLRIGALLAPSVARPAARGRRGDDPPARGPRPHQSSRRERRTEPPRSVRGKGDGM